MADKMTETLWHTMPADEAIRSLDTNINTGLSSAEAENRIGKYGHNQLAEKEGIPPHNALSGAIQ